MKPFRSLFKCLTALWCVTNPVQQIPERLMISSHHGQSHCTPAVLPLEHALIAQNHTKGEFEISWIADSGAGRNLASLKALQNQGIPSQIANQFVPETGRIKFEMGNGHVNGDTSNLAHGNKFGDASCCMMNSCPIVRSMGQIVATRKPFDWLPGEWPFFGRDVSGVQIAADAEQMIVASKIDEHMPIFSE